VEEREKMNAYTRNYKRAEKLDLRLQGFKGGK
jgi:hypothetical protein